jgi:hypothetical protein
MELEEGRCEGIGAMAVWDEGDMEEVSGGEMMRTVRTLGGRESRGSFFLRDAGRSMFRGTWAAFIDEFCE